MKLEAFKQLVEKSKEPVVVSENFDLTNHELMELAEQTEDEAVLKIVADALTKMQTALREAIMDLEDLPIEDVGLNPEQLDEVVAMAALFEESEDPELQKYASVLDQILLTFGADKGAKEQFILSQEQEIEKLREKYRTQGREQAYQNPTKKLDEKIKAAETGKQIHQAVKRYRPLEAPLSTRSCPEHPGAPLQRVGEQVYQCSLDKKVYDFRSGFTTLKGNQIPGGEVTLQTQSLGDRAPDHMSFNTRTTRLSS